MSLAITLNLLTILKIKNKDCFIYFCIFLSFKEQFSIMSQIDKIFFTEFYIRENDLDRLSIDIVTSNIVYQPCSKFNLGTKCV